MYQLGICDDEPVFLNHANTLIDEIMKQYGIPCCIHVFRSKQELLSYMQDESNAHLDLLFLDIYLEDGNGMELAKYLRNSGNEISIAFISNSMDFVLDGYMVEPLGYLIKPLERDRIAEVLLRAYKKFERNRMVIHTPSQTVSFRLDEILYLEIHDKILSIHTKNGTVLEAAAKLNDWTGKLPQEQFVQCHRSYVVALSAISSICRYTIMLKNNEKIPVSKKRYKQVLDALLQAAAII